MVFDHGTKLAFKFHLHGFSQRKKQKQVEPLNGLNSTYMDLVL